MCMCMCMWVRVPESFDSGGNGLDRLVQQRYSELFVQRHAGYYVHGRGDQLYLDGILRGAFPLAGKQTLFSCDATPYQETALKQLPKRGNNNKQCCQCRLSMVQFIVSTSLITSMPSYVKHVTSMSALIFTLWGASFLLTYVKMSDLISGVASRPSKMSSAPSSLE